MIILCKKCLTWDTLLKNHKGSVIIISAIVVLFAKSHIDFLAKFCTLYMYIRVYPVIPFMARMLDTDIELLGYHIPAKVLALLLLCFKYGSFCRHQ